MATNSEQSVTRLGTEIGNDRLEAWILVKDPGDSDPVSCEEILDTLKEAKIEVTDEVRLRINEFVNAVEGKEGRSNRFSIARGTAATEGEDGEFQWDERFEKAALDWQGDAPINYYTFNSLITVEEGETIGTLTPATPGKDGHDVHGAALKPRRRTREVQLADTVRLAEDSAVVTAATSGRVQYENRRLWIDEVLTIKGDVDFECGSVDSAVDVHITGTVHDLFSVKSKKSVSVCGAIEGAEIGAGTDICVRGGILGHGKGSITSEGEIVAKFCDEADLYAGGDVKITKELMNSRVRCESKLLAAHGAVIGGEVYAREGIEVGTLGSDAFVETRLTAGVHPEVLRQAAIVDAPLQAKREACKRIRESVQPLMANVKRLTADQKERATELLFKADEMAAEIDEALECRKEVLEHGRAAGTPYVLVSKIIHSGVTIRIGNRQTGFHEELKGPVKIEKRKIKNVTEFVTVNQLTGSVAVLPSARVVEDFSSESTPAVE